jgi:hypothetical protein
MKVHRAGCIFRASKIWAVNSELSGQLAEILRYTAAPSVCKAFLIYYHLRGMPVLFVYSYSKFSLDKHYSCTALPIYHAKIFAVHTQQLCHQPELHICEHILSYYLVSVTLSKPHIRKMHIT